VRAQPAYDLISDHQVVDVDGTEVEASNGQVSCQLTIAGAGNIDDEERPDLIDDHHAALLWDGGNHEPDVVRSELMCAGM
jgi:hypothetical protein